MVTNNRAIGVTSEDGAFRFDGLAPGTYLLRLTHGALGELNVPVELPADARVEPVLTGRADDPVVSDHLVRRARALKPGRRWPWEARRLEGLVRALGSDDAAEREAADAELRKAGVAAVDYLSAAADGPDAEVRLRAEALLRAIGLEP